MKLRHNTTQSTEGFSLVELIVIVAIVGVLSSLAIPMIGKVTDASKESIAQNLVETLNNATKEFGHAQYPILTNGENNDSDDEELILHTLQWKDPGIPFGIAGPFMKLDWIPATSNVTSDYRIVWSGSYWKLVKPGEAGAGLKVNFDAGDTGVNFSHEADFLPIPPYEEN